MTDTESDSTERLAKVIARSGLCSRREAEDRVEAGRVRVNGETVYHPGHRVDSAKDHIKVDDKPLPAPPPRLVVLLNKPKGYITGRNDPQGRRSVLDLVSHLGFRVEPVGRLDYDTEGALLLTNDGVLAHALTHPSKEIPKRYLAKVWRVPTAKTLSRIRAGIKLDDGRTKPCMARVVETTDGGNAWVEITVTEGRNRLIRRMFETVNHPVSKLRRESVATIAIRDLERGQCRILTGEEMTRLQEILDGVSPADAGHRSRYKTGFARPKPRANKPNSRKKTARIRKGRKLSGPKR